MMKTPSVIMLGATGAVGSACAENLIVSQELKRLTTLGRRPLDSLTDEHVTQHIVDVFDPATYTSHLAGHDVAICTFGVGQPSKISRAAYEATDKDAVLIFATACKAAGVRHFQLLSSVGAHTASASYYLKVKGQLSDALIALEFERLSLFQPSMILTPTNRYGISQAITIRIWPLLTPLLYGGLHKYRGIPVERLGRAIALNVFQPASSLEILHWDEIVALSTL